MGRPPDSIEHRQHIARVNGMRLMVIAVIMAVLILGFILSSDDPRRWELLKGLIIPLAVFGFGFKVRAMGKHGLPPHEMPPQKEPLLPPPPES